MARRSDEDVLEGKFGSAQWPSDEPQPPVRNVLVAKGGDRARTAWFNRQRGQRGVHLKTERPAGSQRVYIKAKRVMHAKLGNGGARALMRQALYVERDGAGRDGDPVHVFNSESNHADAAAFVARCQADRRHYRFIISPEYGENFADLKAFTREFVKLVETDLHTRIDWMAAEHHDTGRPHVHLLMRGVRDDDRGLTIPYPYFPHVLRQRAEELATRALGARVERDPALDQSLERAVLAMRATPLDATLIKRARDSEISVDNLPPQAGERAALVRRLNRLQDFGLAERLASDRWRLDRDLEAKLVGLSETQSRERATAKLLALENRALEPDRIRELETAHSAQRIVGRLVGFERIGNLRAGPFLIGVEAIDGRFWTARITRDIELRVLNGVERGAVLEISRGAPALRPADRQILEIAGKRREYSAALHRQCIPTDRELYIATHISRLQALHRDKIVGQDKEGVFQLPQDFEAKVLEREARGGRTSAHIEVLDRHSIETQKNYLGPTLLDAIGDGRVELSQLRDSGFGRELREAREKRVDALRQLGLGHGRHDGFYLASDATARLRELERRGLLEKVERDTGRVAHFAGEGDCVHGVFVGRLHGGERSFALIEHGGAATLAPWGPELDRALNQTVLGHVRDEKLDFRYGPEVAKQLNRGLDVDV